MFCTFRVSGNAKPHRGLVFFCPKNGIPTGVLGIQSVGKCKTPPGSVVFLSKKWNPHRGSWAFRVSGSAKPHRGLSFFYPKNGIPTRVLGIQSVWKCKTPPGSGVFIVNYPTSCILADNFSLVLFVFSKSLG